jgi:hypothetical protein
MIRIGSIMSENHLKYNNESKNVHLIRHQTMHIITHQRKSVNKIPIDRRHSPTLFYPSF